MKSAYKKAGFTVLTDKKYLTGTDYLLPGDILLYEGHHTATNLGIGSKTSVTKTVATAPTTQENNLTATSKTKFSISKTSTPSKKTIKNGKVTANSLYVRSFAGTEYKPIKTYPIIKKDTIVKICDSILDEKENTWYYIKINDKVYGFSNSKYIK